MTSYLYNIPYAYKFSREVIFAFLLVTCHPQKLNPWILQNNRNAYWVQGLILINKIAKILDLDYTYMNYVPRKFVLIH